MLEKLRDNKVAAIVMDSNWVRRPVVYSCHKSSYTCHPARDTCHPTGYTCHPAGYTCHAAVQTHFKNHMYTHMPG